jgi:hypothetical protein
MGYHPRGACKNEGGCIIYNLFGDLDKPGNLIVPSAYFYPANSSYLKNHEKIFGSIGTGRLEIIRNSPRARSNSHTPYMTGETIGGIMIQSPLNLILRDDNEDQRVLILKTLKYLYEKNVNFDFPYLLGGNRGNGYGRAVLVVLNNSGNYLTRNRNILGIKDEEAKEIDAKFVELICQLKEKFPINNHIKETESEEKGE